MPNFRTIKLGRFTMGTTIVGSMLAASAAFALVGTDFDATDGNLVVDGTETDWANAPNRVAGTDPLTGSSDNSFGQGTKEDSEVPSVVTGSIPPNKSDLTRFYVANDVRTVSGSDHLFLYVAWVRSNVLGTANMDFEFNQDETLSENGVTPVRTAGDILITFDFASGANEINLGLLTWITTGPGSQCEASSSPPCWGNRVDLDDSGFADGSVNLTTVLDPIANENLPELTFGEAAIDLTAAGIVEAGACAPFASVYLKSRSSDSFTSAEKDFVAPQELNLLLCGDINIHKQDDLGNALQGAVFTLYQSDGVTPVSPAITCTTNASGNCTMSNVPSGSYVVVETTTPAGHATADPQPVTISSGGSTVSLTFVDPRQFKVITIVCRQTINTLHASTVVFDGETKTSISTAPTGLTAAQVCGIGGATFGPKEAGTYSGSVTIP